MDKEAELPDSFSILCEGEEYEVYVEYQMSPPSCPHCKTFVHEVKECPILPKMDTIPKGFPSRGEWQKIVKGKIVEEGGHVGVEEEIGSTSVKGGDRVDLVGTESEGGHLDAQAIPVNLTEGDVAPLACAGGDSYNHQEAEDEGEEGKEQSQHSSGKVANKGKGVSTPTQPIKQGTGGKKGVKSSSSKRKKKRYSLP